VLQALSGPAPVVVIAERSLAVLPWEQLSCLKESRSVTRDLSLHIMSHRHTLSRALSREASDQAAGFSTAEQPCGQFATGERCVPKHGAGALLSDAGRAIASAAGRAEHTMLSVQDTGPDSGSVPPASGLAVGILVDPFNEMSIDIQHRTKISGDARLSPGKQSATDTELS